MFWAARTLRGRIKRKGGGWDEWLGIVDRYHRHKVILRLVRNIKTWKHFLRYVAVMKNCFPIEKYRQLAQAQNACSSSCVYVPITFYNTLKNFCKEYDCLVKKKAPANESDRVKVFSDYSSKNVSDILQNALTAARIPPKVLGTIGLTVNSK